MVIKNYIEKVVLAKVIVKGYAYTNILSLLIILKGMPVLFCIQPILIAFYGKVFERSLWFCKKMMKRQGCL